MNAPSGPDLRDIHLPPPPSWWPPAPGWWIVAVLLLAVLVAGVWMLARQWREHRWRRRVLAELDRIAATHAAQPDAVQLAADVSRLLRRASLLIEPDAAALHGEAWLEFLDRPFRARRHSGGMARFRTDTGRALLDAPYRRRGDASTVDANALIGLARDWLRHALRRRRSRV